MQRLGSLSLCGLHHMIVHCDICHTCKSLLDSSRFCALCGCVRNYACHGNGDDSTPCPDTSTKIYQDGATWIAERRFESLPRSVQESYSPAPPVTRFRSICGSLGKAAFLTVGAVAMLPLVVVLGPFALAWKLAEALDKRKAILQ